MVKVMTSAAWVSEWDDQRGVVKGVVMVSQGNDKCCVGQ